MVCVLALAGPAPFAVGGWGSTAAEADSEGASGREPSTPLLSARRVPGLVADGVARGRLAWAVGGALGRSTASTCALVADDRGTIVEVDTDAPLVPASTLKLATAAVAVEVLGGDYRWTTSAVASAPPADGVLAGDLVLVGGGDPLLATTGFAASLPAADARAETSLEALADGVVASGVRRVGGSVLGDDRRYDSERAVASWDPSYLQGATVGSLGALRVNRGLTGWVAEPGRPGLRGDAGDPAVLAAETFVTLLRQRGVEVAGGAAAGPAPADAVTLSVVESPPLLDVVTEILAWSDNGASELVLKELGLVAGTGPTTAAGIAVVADRLGSWGMPLGGFAMVDGSGLDTGNRVTCELLVALMRRITAVPDLVTRLAVGGQSGTLAGRLGEVDTAGVVWAKTGSLNTVRSLAGVTLGADGRAVYFAWVANGPLGDPGLDTAVVDEVVGLLRTYPDAPSIEELGPRPPAGGP